jgi:uncharacterized membrane protein
MRKWIPLLIVVAAAVASLVVYPTLPATVVTHWDIHGNANGWSSRFWGAWLMPIFLVAVWAFMRILPAIDPKGRNYAKFGSAFEGIIISIMLFLLGLHIIVLRSAMGYPVAMQRVLPLGMGALFVVMGNLLPRARPNWFVGIRTPWTLSSDRVWEKTHRFGGKIFVAGGILILLTALVAPDRAHIALMGVVAASAAAVLIYSYVEWRRSR